MRRSLILLLFLSGCLPNNGLGTGSAAQINIYRLHEICLGMSEEEVFRIMHFPEIDEQIFVKDACYDVWFYVTRITAMGQGRLRPYNLTPLIFKDGILVAKGYDYYYFLRKQEKEEPAQPAVSMSSKPASQKNEQPAQTDEEPEPETEYHWDQEDERIIEQEQDQNFDYW